MSGSCTAPTKKSPSRVCPKTVRRGKGWSLIRRLNSGWQAILPAAVRSFKAYLSTIALELPHRVPHLVSRNGIDQSQSSAQQLTQVSAAKLF